jgi:hypothetical protein
MAFSLVACGSEPLAVSGSRDHMLSVSLGPEFSITLQTVGPGEYESQPTVFLSAIRFLDVAFVSPFVPAGPTQRFRFKAEAQGDAIVRFRHSGDNPMVTYTVEVR